MTHRWHRIGSRAVLLASLVLAAAAGDRTQMEALLAANTRAQMKALLAAGTDVNARGKEGRTALHEAAKAGQVDVVRLLIYHQADVHARDISQCTPLFYALETGNVTIANLLFNRGAKVNERANDYRAGNSPLHEAARARANARALVELLLAKGAAINVRNEYGETPLDYAMWSNNRDAAQLLLARSVDRTLSGAADVAIQDGLAAAKADNVMEAVRYFEAARRLAPDSPLPRLYLAQAEARISGRELRAICWFEAYLAAVPHAPERRAIRAEIAILQARSTDQLREVLVALTAAADLLPAPSEHEAANPLGTHRDRALQTVAVLWMRLGGEAMALERAGGVPNTFVRSLTESRIAEAIAGTGDVPAGRRIAAQAITSAASISRRDQRDRAFATAALVLANLDDLAGARAAAGRIEDAGRRCGTQVAIARVQANAGGVAEALASAGLIPVAFSRASAQAAIARAAAEAGDQPVATQALQQARQSLARVPRDNSDPYAPFGTAPVPGGTIPVPVTVVGIPIDPAGREIYPPPPPPLSVTQASVRERNVVQILRDYFVAEGLLGDFNRQEAWKYQIAFNLAPLVELGLARARLGDDRGAAAVFDYLKEPGPWNMPIKEWSVEVQTGLAEVMALRGDDVGAAYRLGLARAAAEKIENDERRSRAQGSVATVANGWIAANDGLLDDLPFLNLQAHLQSLPRLHVVPAFDALAETTLALADAQRAVAMMRLRPIQP